MAFTDNNNNSIQVEFICKPCRDGKHGCAGRWTGIGLEIQCTCICIMQARRTGKEDSNTSHNSRSTFTTTSKTRIAEIGVISIEANRTESTKPIVRTCELKPPSKHGIKLQHWNDNNSNRNSEFNRSAKATNLERQQVDFETDVTTNLAEEDRGGSTVHEYP